MIFSTHLAQENWATKYRYDGETPLETYQRVARALAEVERQYGADDEQVEQWYDRFLKTFIRLEPYNKDTAAPEDLDSLYHSKVDGMRYEAKGLKCTPAGRITANAGTSYEKATLLNCFVSGPVTNAEIKYRREVPNTDQYIDVEIEGEETPDNLVNIMLSLLEQAETLKSEGGYGINFDFIRPRGALIEGVGIRHPGVVAYMDLWDKVSEIIVKGDNDGYEDELTNHLEDSTLNRLEKAMPRKGAMMGCLSVWHPDIEEFVKAKQEKGCLTKFNISVVVDDKFMQAVADDDFYDLHFDGEVYKRVKARELYDLIMGCTYNRNEPGVLFYDNMNRVNPISYLGENNATNPCVTGDTWVLTSKGPRQVTDLLGKRFSALVNGCSLPSTERGFWVTGEGSVMTLKTSRGYTLRLTANHKLKKVTEQTRYGISSEWVEVSDLSVGDKIRLSDQREVSSWGGRGTFSEGWVLGSLVGDGTFAVDSGRIKYACLDYWGDERKGLQDLAVSSLEKQGLSVNGVWLDEEQRRVRVASSDLIQLAASYGIVPDNKSVTDHVEKASSDFQLGFLRGLFDADGSVQGTQDKGLSVRLSQSDLSTLQGVQRMLMRFGIASTLYEERREAGPRSLPDGKDGYAEYECRADHELVIACSNLSLYAEKVGFASHDKSTALSQKLSSYQRSLNRERFVDAIASIELSGKEKVYDATINEAHEFDANGLRAHNCGEIPGSPYFTTVCLLGSVNLTQYVRPDRTFDWGAYEEDVETFARALENVNDIGNVPLPHYAWALKNVRQYGMGINGLGSALYMLAKGYDTNDGVRFAEEVCQRKEDITLRSSALLAAERGPAPLYDERFLETKYFTEHCTASEKTKELVRKHGMRNLKTTTNPPLGNTSVVCDNVSNGIEPIFSQGYNRTVIADKWPEGLTRDNVKELLDEIEVGDTKAWRGEYQGRLWHYEPHNRGLCFIEPVEDYGYGWVREHYLEDLEDDFLTEGDDRGAYLVTSQDISIRDHIRMQSVIQANVNQSVSKTSNLPNDYSFDDFKDLYFLAWESGLIGFTTYRAGTMETVLDTGDQDPAPVQDLLASLIASGAADEKVEVTEEGVIVSDVRLPRIFDNGPTHKIEREGNKYYMHLSYLPCDSTNPIALWLHSNDYANKEYVTLNRAFKSVTKLLLDKGVETDLVLDQVEKIKDDAYHVKLGKIISMAMRHNISLLAIIEALDDIEGDYVATTLSAVRKFLRSVIPDGTEAYNTCDACGSDQVIFESGCDKCLACGNSGCS